MGQMTFNFETEEKEPEKKAEEASGSSEMATISFVILPEHYGQTKEYDVSTCCGL